MLNTAISLGRLGVQVYMVTDFGEDRVGALLEAMLKKNNVSTEFIRKNKNYHSALALAFLDESNEAAYQFYKDYPGKRLEDVEIDFTNEDIILFGSFFAINESVRNSVTRLISAASDADSLIIYDPNFRTPHLHELDRVRPLIIENMHFADIIRGSDSDFELIFDAKNLDQAYNEIQKAGCSHLIYTSNRNGAYVKTPDVNIQVNAMKIEPVSTIGAGDNFNAGIIWTLLQEGLNKGEMKKLSSSFWKKAIKNGVAFASDVCLQYDNYISESFAEKIRKE